MSSKTFAIIPARGGSKQIPRKNIMNFCGKPLLAWSILQAKASKYVDEVYVTSDCDEILLYAKRFGATPIKRPEHLATDFASSEDALVDALEQIQQMNPRSYDFFVFLQATSPLRDQGDLDLCIEKKLSTQADTVFSAVASGDLCVWQRDQETLRPITYQPGVRLPRQQAKQLMIENGSIYVCDIKGFLKTKNRMLTNIEACTFPSWKVHEIDDMDNVVICEALFRRHDLGKMVSPSILDFQPKLIVYDFDGVMTNNMAIVNQDGYEAVAVNRSDGLGINKFRQKGLPQLILSTESNPVVAARAKKLNLDVIHNCPNKKETLLVYCKNNQIPIEQVCYVGNDVNDLEAFQSVGYKICPSDAHPHILAIADYVTKAKGGEGVIRELSDLI